MLPKTLLILCLLFLVAVDQSGAQTAAHQDTANSWIATSSTGVTLMGTWTVVPDLKTGAVTGSWTLVDAQGRTLAGGGWSAAKSPEGWTGAWRAAVAGHQEDHGGTWSADVDLKAKAPFADLFEKAVQTVVGGNWRYGRYSGTWSIKAY